MPTNSKLNCILLVDDDPDDIFLHQMVIKESGICPEIKIAENGEAAWQYFTEPKEDFQKPDLILLDINMPRINGFEFLSLYKSLCEQMRSDISVAILSTSTHPKDYETAQSIYPGVQYFPKPLTEEILLSLVNNRAFLTKA